MRTKKLYIYSLYNLDIDNDESSTCNECGINLKSWKLKGFEDTLESVDELRNWIQEEFDIYMETGLGGIICKLNDLRVPFNGRTGKWQDDLLKTFEKRVIAKDVFPITLFCTHCYQKFIIDRNLVGNGDEDPLSHPKCCGQHDVAYFFYRKSDAAQSVRKAFLDKFPDDMVPTDGKIREYTSTNGAKLDLKKYVLLLYRMNELILPTFAFRKN